MQTQDSKTQFIFLDESGKPEVYSAKGINLVEKGQATKFLVLAAVRANSHLLIQQQVTAFKSILLRDPDLTKIFSSAYALDSFHAQTDYHEVKEKFYRFINTLEIKIDVLVVEKLKCYESLKRHPGKMYGVMSGQMLKNICHQAMKTEIIFSRKDSKLKLRQELEVEIERIRLGYLNQHKNLDGQFTLSYQHNPHYTHSGLQIADYIAYAIFQVFENNKWQWYEIIKNKIGRIQDICNKKYFTQSNPLQLST